MPKTKQTAPARTAEPAAPADDQAADELPLKADALFRSAMECCRQHQRYACLVEADALEEEQQRCLQAVTACDQHLCSAALAWEAAVAVDGARRDEQWWRCANGLWHAAREYVRRHRLTDHDASRLASHHPTKLARLTLEFDLEASALLALQHALGAYRKCRPQADLSGCRPAAS